MNIKKLSGEIYSQICCFYDELEIIFVPINKQHRNETGHQIYEKAHSEIIIKVRNSIWGLLRRKYENI